MNSEELPLRLAAALELMEAESGREFTDDEKSIFSIGFWAGAEMANKYAIEKIDDIAKRISK